MKKTYFLILVKSFFLSLLHRLDKKVMASKIVKKEVMSDEIKVIEKMKREEKKLHFCAMCKRELLVI